MEGNGKSEQREAVLGWTDGNGKGTWGVCMLSEIRKCNVKSIGLCVIPADYIALFLSLHYIVVCCALNLFLLFIMVSTGYYVYISGVMLHVRIPLFCFRAYGNKTLDLSQQVN